MQRLRSMAAVDSTVATASTVEAVSTGDAGKYELCESVTTAGSFEAAGRFVLRSFTKLTSSFTVARSH